jgi:MFS family permease
MHALTSALEGPPLRRALRLSVAEGCTWALMIGLAESYFIAIAVHLGATPLQLGLVVALPLALGGLGPLTAIALLRWRPRRRPLAVAAVAVQVAVLAGLSLLLARGRLALPELIAGICLYQMAGQGAGTAWASWYGDVVAAETRGRWFSFRNRFIYLATTAGLVGGGLIMHRLAPGGTAAPGSASAFAVLLGLAAVFRLMSGGLLLASPEPEFRGLLPRRQAVMAARTRQGGQALRILLLGALFHFTVYWSSPYFAPFMFDELQFTYLQYMAASLTAILAKMAASLGWGRLVDRYGARGVFLVCMVFIALIPLPWVWARGLGVVIFAQLVSGSSWSGFEVGYLSLLLENSRSRERPYLFALQSLGNGWMQLAGAMVASLVIMPRVGGFRDIFAISMAGRLLVAMSAPLVLAGLERGARPALAEIGWRVFGLRPHGGFSVRPILPSDDTPEAGGEAD